jgi:hypothetical protein
MRKKEDINKIVEDSNAEIYNTLVRLALSFQGSNMSNEELFDKLAKSISFMIASSASDVAAEIIRVMAEDPEVSKTDAYRKSRVHLHSTIMVLAELYKRMDNKEFDCVKRVRIKLT